MFGSGTSCSDNKTWIFSIRNHYDR
jgi:hypothetical protein